VMTRHYGAEATNALLPGKASKHQVTSNRLQTASNHPFLIPLTNSKSTAN